MDKPFFGRYTQLLSALAVLASLIFVGYELKKNNDLAIVQSQHELISLNVEMKSWLTDPEIFDLLITKDIESMSEKQRLLFTYLVGSWFDLYEAAFIARERGILTDEQIRVWRNGMCSLPEHWFLAFQNGLDENTYVEALVEQVKRCQN